MLFLIIRKNLTHAVTRLQYYLECWTNTLICSVTFFFPTVFQLFLSSSFFRRKRECFCDVATRIGQKTIFASAWSPTFTLCIIFRCIHGLRELKTLVLFSLYETCPPSIIHVLTYFMLLTMGNCRSLVLTTVSN